MTWLDEHRTRLLAAFAFGALVLGGILHLARAGRAGDGVWTIAVALLASSCWWRSWRTVFVYHHMGVDSIAMIAMIGSLALGETLAGMIVGLTFSGGAALEEAAASRAKRELTALMERAPKVAQVRRDGDVEEVPVDDVEPGDVCVTNAEKEADVGAVF